MNHRAQAFILYGIVAGVVLGGAAGWYLGAKMTSVAWIGGLFLDALKMIVVPLVVSSMIVGISSLGDVRRIGRTGGVTLAFFLLTTAVAVVIGICLVNAIRPGVGFEWRAEGVPDIVRGKEKIGITDIVRTFVTPNLVEAAAKTEILPLIVFSLVFGGVLTTLGERGRRVIDFFDGVNEAMLKVVFLVLLLAPLGVFALVASRLGQAGGGAAFFGDLKRIGLYAATVLLGLAIHGGIVLPLVVLLLARRSPWRHFAAFTPALTTAFSTASSSATLPVTIECSEERARISRRSSLFVLPLGATVNMNGTALYEAVAAVFIAQANGIPLGAWEQTVIVLTATLAAIGAPGIPEAGLVTMVIVLRAVGLPLEGIGMILAIDWFLDRCRTTVNVFGDTVGAAVLDRLDPVREKT